MTHPLEEPWSLSDALNYFIKKDHDDDNLLSVVNKLCLIIT